MIEDGLPSSKSIKVLKLLLHAEQETQQETTAIIIARPTCFATTNYVEIDTQDVRTFFINKRIDKVNRQGNNDLL